MKKSLISLFFLFFLFPYPSPAVAASTFIIDYQLPYPGILPDSPIYPLKEIRDKITGFLINNPLKKAEFDLLKADVRMSAAISLIERKERVSLMQTTISKAQDYFSEALKKTGEAKEQGMDTREFVKRLVTANQKHQETVVGIEKKIDKKDRNKFELVKKRIQALGREVKKIR